MRIKQRQLRVPSGFTIVELLIVIVVIGILAAMTIVAFSGIQDRAKISVIKADLSSAQKKLALYQISNQDNYPVDLATGGVTDSANTAFQYSVNNSAIPKTYCVTAISGDLGYYLSTTVTSPTSGICAGHTAPGAVACATGYILVPGNATFGTSAFCVMKYEARNSAGVATSTDTGLPWTSISQTNSVTTAAAACAGCHLITEDEWMTITANALGVGSNWSGGTPGNGAIYRGHSDAAPNSLIAASSSDSNGYANTGDSSGTQRRTLTLSNGEVIWDLAGNAFEWTAVIVAANQSPGIASDAGNSWKEYNNGALVWRGLPTNSKPANVYTGAGSWSSTQGIGQINSNYNQTLARAVFRGGSYNSDIAGGILSASLGSDPSATSPAIGFRVVRAPN